MASDPPEIPTLPPAVPPLAPPKKEPTGADVTRERLLQAAHELLHERAGGPVSIAEISSRAGANVAMVKYCFGSKDALLDALVERVMGQLAGEIDHLGRRDLPVMAKLRRHVVGVVRNYFRYPYVNRLINERLMSAKPDAVERMSRAFAIPAREWYGDLLAEGQRTGELRPLDPTLFFFSLIGACEFLFAARPWLEHGFGGRLDEELVDRYATHVAEMTLLGAAPIP